jgi:TIR domain
MREYDEKHTFISYNSKDYRFVDRLTTGLRALGVRVWLDRVEIRPGDSLRGRLQAAIENAEHVIVVLSDNSVHSTWVNVELSAALAKQRLENRRLVIPVLYRKCEIPLFLADLAFVDFTDSRKFQTRLRVLASALEDTQPVLPTSQQPDVVHPRTNLETVFGPLSERARSLFPFVEILHGALRFNGIASGFRDEAMILLGAMSHTSDEVQCIHVAALNAFIEDLLASGIPIHPDIVRLIAAIVNSRQIQTNVRLETLQRLPNIIAKVPSRRLRHEAFPDIFPARGFDRLADDLVDALFSADANPPDHPFGRLWRLASIPIREEMVSYIIRTSIWKNEPSIRDELEALEIGPLIRHLKPKWSGSNARDVQCVDFERSTNIVRRAIHSEPADLGDLFGAIEFIGRMTGALYFQVLEAVGIVSDDRMTTLRAKHGDESVFRLLTALAASPYIGPVGSFLSLIGIAKYYTLDSLRYTAEFPMCLFALRENETTDSVKQRSVLQFLLQNVTNGSGSDEISLPEWEEAQEFVYTLLCTLFQVFDSDVLRWILRHELRTIPNEKHSEQYEAIASYAHGDISAARLGSE